MSTKLKPEVSAQVPPEEEPYPSSGYAWYVVGVLTFVYIFSFIDRQILSLLVTPIKRDLGISDTGVALLGGTSFAVFYTFFGIILGKMADSRSRRGLIAAGFVFWSIFTAGCGLARNFWQMLLLRMGVGVGEAALSPAAYSLLTDYFPKERRATAISVYSMGIYLGSGLALVVGGVVTRLAQAQEMWNLPVVGATRPWQVVFFIVGLPGVILALLMYTVKEPKRRGVLRLASGKIQQIPMRAVFDYIKQNKLTFFCHNVGFALLSFSSYGTTAWIPSFLERNHGWTRPQAGVVYGTMIMVFSTLGIVAGGWFADKLAARGRRDATMVIGFLVSFLWFPFGIYPLMPTATWSLVLLAPALFLASAPFGVAPAAITQMMPPNMRGQASAVYLFVVNLIGLGVGPTAIALITDLVFGGVETAVKYSIVIATMVAHIASTIILWYGMKAYSASLDRLEEWTKQSVKA